MHLQDGGHFDLAVPQKHFVLEITSALEKAQDLQRRMQHALESAGSFNARRLGN